MTLRTKNFLIINGAAGILLLVIALAARAIIMHGFADLELAQMQRDLTRLQASILASRAALVDLARPLSLRGETSRLARGEASRLVLPPKQSLALAQRGVGLLAVANAKGALVGGARLRQGQAPAPLAPATARQLAALGLLRPADLPGPERAGLAIIGGRPWQVVCLPVPDGEDQARPAGILLMGREVDQRGLDVLGQVMQAKVEISPLGQGPPRGSRPAGPGWVRHLDEKRLRAGLIVSDISGRPSIMLAYTRPRALIAKALDTFGYLLAAVVAVCIIMIAITLTFTNHFILGRLIRVTARVVALGQSGDPRARVGECGQDEVGRLAGEIDALLDAKSLAAAQLESTQALYRAVTETVTCGVFIVQESRIVFMNPAGERMCGYTADELRKMDFWELVHPDHRALVRSRSMARQRGESVPNNYEFMLEHPRLGEVWVELTSAVINHQGAPAVLGTTFDITARKKAEAELRESEERFRSLFETLPMGVVYQERGGEIVAANPAASEILGLSLDEMLGRTSLDPRWKSVREDGREYPGHQHPTMVALATGKTVSGEVIGVFNPRKEQLRWLVVDAVPEFRPGESAPYRAYCTFRDNTEHRAAVAAVAESEEKFRKFADEASFDGVVIHQQGVILDVNQHFCDMHGYTREEVLNMSAWETMAEPWREKAKERVAKGLETPYEIEGLRKDGSTFPIEVRVKNLVMNGRPVRASSVRDISERKENERKLKEAHQRYLTLFERAGDAIFILEAEGEHLGRIVEANQAAADMHGYSRRELIGMYINQLDVPEEAPLMEKRFQKIHEDDWYKDEIWRVRKDGSRFPMEIAAGPVILGEKLHVVSFGRDVSARHEAQKKRRALSEQLRQAQKMEAVGTLAGGIAHDFNNVLQAVGGYLRLLGLKGNDQAAREDYLGRMQGVLERAAGTVRQLLAFSRRLEPRLAPVNLNETVEETLAILSASLPKMIELVRDLAEDLPLVNADATQIEQVILNLAANAGHAMPEGGRLTLSTRPVSLPPDDQPGRPAGGEYLRLSVSDTGMGIDRRTIDKIFEPFFTTKKEGVGTGLGLAMVYGIVEAHGGFIRVESLPGQGATFHLHFPVLSHAAPSRPAEHNRRPTAAGHGETVLLVDDEKALLESGAEILALGGYRVLTAESGEAALQIYSSEPKVDAVLLDLSMPGIGGEKTLEKLMQMDPGAKVVLCSGYSDQLSAAAGREKGAVDFLNKPFRYEELFSKLHDLFAG